jgi:CubicO group peptidase (beta-lactamase class C family)
MQANRLPGLAVGLVHGDQIVHLRGFGIADPSGRAVTPQTPFIIGSDSKSFTALAIMQLVEAGKLGLDDPVQQYLPWFQVADATASARITVRQLLNQNSGLQDPTEPPAVTEAIFAQSVRRPSLDRPVGTSYEYANVNYALLGQIVQAVSGESYAAYVQQHIFAPLGMQHSFPSLQQARQAGLAQGYTWRFGASLPSEDHLLPIPTILPAGLLASTAEDMSHYLIAQMNGGRYRDATLLSAAGIAMMHTPPRVPGSTPYPYAMGWVAATVAGIPVVGHNGSTDTFYALMLIVPQTQWGAVLLSNSSGAVFRILSDSDLPPSMARLLAGQELPPAGLSMSTFYLISDSLLALLAVLVLGWTLRLPWWYSRTRRRALTPPRVQWWRVIAAVSWEFVLPAVLLLGIPLALGGFSWPQIVFALPDVGWASLALLTLWLLVGAGRTLLRVLVLRARRRGISPLVSPLQPSLT